MEILSDELIIKKDEVNFLEIEDYLKEKGIHPLRWAVTQTDEESYLINYSYKK